MTVAEFQNVIGQAEPSLYNPAAENQFIACLIARPDWLLQAAQQVPVNWLHFRGYRAIYEAMRSMQWTASQGGWQPRFDVEAMYAFLSSQGRVEEFCQATQQLDTLKTAQTLACSPEFNAEQVIQRAIHCLRESAVRVALFRQSAKMLNDAITTKDSAAAAQIVAAAQNELLQLCAGLTQTAQGIRSVGDGDLLTHGAQGIRPSHLPRLCDLNGGFRPATLSLICARTNVGKSVFMGSIALDVAVHQQIPVLYLDTEMGLSSMLRRSVSWLTGLDENMLFQHGGYDTNPELKRQADEAQARIKSSPFFHVDIGAMSLDQTASIMRQFRRLYVDTSPSRRGLIVFDYLKAPAQGRIPEWQLLGDLALSLRTLAKELDLPIIAGMQGSRAALQFTHSDYAENGVAIAAGSDRPSHHADLFCVLRNLQTAEAQRVSEHFGHVEAEHPRNRLRFNQVLHVSKTRGGPTLPEGIPLYYQHGTARYFELAYAPNGERVESDEIKFLHSPQFQRKTAGAKPPLKGQPMKMAG